MVDTKEEAYSLAKDIKMSMKWSSQNVLNANFMDFVPELPDLVQQNPGLVLKLPGLVPKNLV